jgi:hypothetical protein
VPVSNLADPVNRVLAGAIGASTVAIVERRARAALLRVLLTTVWLVPRSNAEPQQVEFVSVQIVQEQLGVRTGQPGLLPQARAENRAPPKPAVMSIGARQAGANPLAAAIPEPAQRRAAGPPNRRAAKVCTNTSAFGTAVSRLDNPVSPTAIA